MGDRKLRQEHWREKILDFMASCPGEELCSGDVVAGVSGKRNATVVYDALRSLASHGKLKRRLNSRGRALWKLA